MFVGLVLVDLVHSVCNKLNNIMVEFATPHFSPCRSEPLEAEVCDEQHIASLARETAQPEDLCLK